jgi:hypothetical protein
VSTSPVLKPLVVLIIPLRRISDWRKSLAMLHRQPRDGGIKMRSNKNLTHQVFILTSRTSKVYLVRITRDRSVVRKDGFLKIMSVPDQLPLHFPLRKDASVAVVHAVKLTLAMAPALHQKVKTNTWCLSEQSLVVFFNLAGPQQKWVDRWLLSNKKDKLNLLWNLIKHTLNSLFPFLTGNYRQVLIMLFSCKTK